MKEKGIVEYLRSHGGTRPRAIARGMGVTSRDYKAFRKKLEAMAREGKLEARKGRYWAAPGGLLGRIELKRGGYGFVALVGGRGTDVFIPEESLGGAADGDLVEIKVEKRGRGGRRPRGEVVKVAERASGGVLGVYYPDERGGYVLTDGPAGPQEVALEPGDTEAELGDKVEVEITRWPAPNAGGKGKLAKSFGPAGEWEAELRALVSHYGFERKFPEEVLEEERAASGRIEGNELLRRADYRRLSTVTIDPEDARDFDDAISLERARSGGWVLRVHITDVSHYVREGSAIDDEARERSTSVYLPGMVVRMLPKRLTTDVCCLSEGKDRRAKTVTLAFSAKGKLASSKIERSVIRSDKRLSYAHAYQVIEGRRPRELPKAIERLLRDARELHEVLRERRKHEGSILLDFPEARLVMEGAEIKAVVCEEYDYTHAMIEEFMLAANTAVARYTSEWGVPSVYREHEAPEPEKLRDFARVAAAFGLKLKPPYTRRKLQKAVESAKEEDSYAVQIALLRSMKRARYTERPAEHYALAFRRYCHFTSPIRRYPDLLVHRALDGLFSPGESELPKKLSRNACGGVKERRKRNEFLARVAERASRMERIADEAEKEMTRLGVLTYLSKNPEAALTGRVSRIDEAGLLIELDEFRIFGRAWLDELPGGPHKAYKKGVILEPRRKAGRAYRLGQEVKAKLRRIDLIARVLELSLLEG